MNPDKNYCGKCGAELLRKFIDMHFNPLTGKQEFNILWKCPQKKWWNGHWKFKSDEQGNTYGFEI